MRVSPHVPGALGLPAHIAACLFDLDGVITRTEVLHARAWAQIFDAFLASRPTSDGQPARPFDPVVDYDRYVDGRSRADGVARVHGLERLRARRRDDRMIRRPR